MVVVVGGNVLHHVKREGECLRWKYPTLKYRLVIWINWIFLSRVSILTRYIDIANLSVRPSVRYVPVPDENGLTYRHSSLTIQ